MNKILRLEYANVHRLNDLMIEYHDPETGETTIMLTIEIDQNNHDLREYLLDFGCAGLLEQQLAAILAESTQGYRHYRKDHSGGSWTKALCAFRGYI